MTRQTLRLCRIALLGIFLLSRGALAAGTEDVAVSGAWARATVPGQPVAAAYLDISSRQGATLIAVRSDAADLVYGTPDAFERLGLPYVAHIEPPTTW